MVKFLVLQIAGTSKYTYVTHIINGQSYKAKLAALAVAQYLSHNNEGFTKVVILVPDSALDYNTIQQVYMGNESTSNIGEYRNYLRESVERFKNEKILGEDQNYAKLDITTEPFWSIGKYPLNAGNGKTDVVFKNCIQNIVAMFFCILNRYAREGFSKLYFVVTTGLNIYVVAFMEALRFFILDHKFSRILQEKEEDFGVSLVFHEPVIGSVAEVNLTFEDYDIRGFFSIPYSNYNQDPPLIRGEALNGDVGELKRKFKEYVGSEFIAKTRLYLKLLAILYNAIINNAPLALAHLDEIVKKIFYRDRPPLDKLDSEVSRHKKNLLEQTLNFILRHIKHDSNEINFACIDHRTLLNIYLSLSLLQSITKFYRSERNRLVSIDPCGKNNQRKYVELEELHKVFRDVYEKLGLHLNLRFFERDKTEIHNITKNLAEGEEKLLDDLYRSSMGNYPARVIDVHDKRISDPKRNFYAHSGLLRNKTYILRCKNKIYVRYDEEFLRSNLVKWLEKPK